MTIDFRQGGWRIVKEPTDPPEVLKASLWLRKYAYATFADAEAALARFLKDQENPQ